jgi:2-polyprenyl-6-methoxyphenol hydroxylase-like FAD-dependent oxidoreductase
VILIGDAAHITSPHIASGAAIATEDSVVLAELLGSGTSLARALESFMARRHARCTLVVENSLQLGEWEKDPATPAAQVSALMRQTWATLAEPI